MKKINAVQTKLWIIIIFCFINFVYTPLNAQVLDSTYKIMNLNRSMPVKNQDMTGTCWSFATSSFIESEMIRMGHEDVDLSEMYFARCSYLQKAIRYAATNGKTELSEGGLSHDVMNILNLYGAVPNIVYSGKNHGELIHNHEELVMILKSIADTLVRYGYSNYPQRVIEAFDAILDVYLGKIPTTFTYQNRLYTPATYAKEVIAINPDDYVEITSYKNHEFYKQYQLDVPDNWSQNSKYFNVNVNELTDIIDTALFKGYTVAWDGDVTEDYFKHLKGTAVLPFEVVENKPKTEITDDMRQATFDDKTTTDDHLMHITGIAKSKNGTKFYITKNSWGANSNSCGGFIYMSESYVKLKTIAIMVHKNAIPKYLASKLKF